MEKVYLSDAGPKVSPAIYGFWRWDDYGVGGKSAMERIIDLCLELGINTFDHADVYGGYKCEQMFGEVIRSKNIRREDIVLFTKCGRVLPHAARPSVHTPYIDSSAEHIIEGVEQSLRNLGTDYIDIFLLDHLDPLSNLEETALALERLRSSGKIRNIGVSGFSVFQHQLLASHLRIPIVTHHLELNLLQTQALDNGQLDYIKQRYTRLLAAAPLADGRIENGTDAKALLIRGLLNRLARQYETHLESVAVAWLVKLGALPLIGTMSEQRIRNVVAAFNINLERQDWYALYRASQSGEGE